jgi:2',3'-cyclic-nucleotide 2'-phosphodiesterase (5'-nucleotidase family)
LLLTLTAAITHLPAATYKEGQTVELHVLLTTNHYGRFEFRLCPAGATKDEQCRKLER